MRGHDGLFDRVAQLHLTYVQRQDGDKEEGLEEEVRQEAHQGQVAKLLDPLGVFGTEQETDGENSHQREQVLGDVPPLATEALSNANLDVEVSWGRNNTSCHDEDVFEADEGHEVRDEGDLAVHVEADPGEAERHAHGGHDGHDGADGDAQRALDILDAFAREVHVQKHHQDGDDEGDPVGVELARHEVEVRQILVLASGAVVIAAVFVQVGVLPDLRAQGVDFVQVVLEGTDELWRMFVKHDRDSIGDHSLSISHRVLGDAGVPLPEAEHEICKAAVAVPLVFLVVKHCRNHVGIHLESGRISLPQVRRGDHETAVVGQDVRQ